MSRYISENKELMQEWDWEANADLDPAKITYGSKKKVWWKCPKCLGKWQAAVCARTGKDKTGCPYCAGRKVLPGFNDLATINPRLATEWHPTKNGDLKATDVTVGSQRKVWWKCSKCGYEWKAKVGNRTILDRGCPCCSNTIVVTGKNDLQTTHHEISKEWHPTKNGDLTPQKVSYGCGKKVWWICSQGHEYQATVNHRTGKMGTNCPICYSGRQTSFAEQAFFYYIKKMYPDAINRYKAPFLDKMELDIFIPSIKIAIEYDGMAWHKENKCNREQKKYKICRANDIYLIRLREKECNYKNVADECISISNLYKQENLDAYIPRVLLKLDVSISRLWGNQKLIFPSYDVDIKRDRVKILNEYRTEYKKESFGDLYPEIAKEWHPEKNKELTPYMFKPMSDHKVWWKCSKCGYEYEATIGHRTYGYGCMKCGIEKSTQAKRKAVNMIDSKTNMIIQTFISISDASRKMKISSGNIAMVCQGIRPKAGGYIWRYADEEETKKHLKHQDQFEFDFMK